MRKVHNHLFPGANTGLFALLKDEPRYKQHADGFQKTIDMHADFLRGTARTAATRSCASTSSALEAGGSDRAGRLIAPAPARSCPS